MLTCSAILLKQKYLTTAPFLLFTTSEQKLPIEQDLAKQGHAKQDLQEAVVQEAVMQEAVVQATVSDQLLELILPRLTDENQSRLLDCLQSERSDRDLGAFYHDLIFESADGGLQGAVESQLIEGLDPLAERGIAQVTVIRSGLNNNKTVFYPKEVLARDYTVFEGVQMFLDHPEGGRFGRSVKDFVGVLTKVHPNENGEIVAEAAIIDDGFKTKLRALKNSGHLSHMGVSILSDARYRNTLHEGRTVKMVDRLLHAHSVDFVTSPNAGGVVHVFESASDLTVETLKSERPDIVAAILSEAQFKEEIMAKETGANSSIANGSIANEGRVTEGRATDTEKGAESLVAESLVAESNREALASLQAVNRRLLERMEASELRALRSEKNAILVESALPEASCSRLSSLFSSELDIEKFRQAVIAEGEYVQSLRIPGRTGLGARTREGASSAPGENKTVTVSEAFSLIYGKEDAEKMAAMR